MTGINILYLKNIYAGTYTFVMNISQILYHDKEENVNVHCGRVSEALNFTQNSRTLYYYKCYKLVYYMDIGHLLNVSKLFLVHVTK